MHRPILLDPATITPNPACVGQTVQLGVTVSGVTLSDITWSWSSTPAGFTSSIQNPTFIPSLSDNGKFFEVTATNVCNTDQQPTGSLTFNASPSITVEVDECMGTTPGDSYYILTAASGGTTPYTFSGSPVISVGNQRVYDVAAGNSITVTVTDANNCTASNSATAPSGRPQDLPLTPFTTGSVTANCYDVNLNRWVTFRDNSNNAILSINDNINGGPVNNNLGLVNVTVYKDAAEPSIYTTGPNCQNFTDFKAMTRHFVITTTNAPTAGEPVGIRLYFTQDEANSLNAESRFNNDPNNIPCTENDDFSDALNLTDLYVTKYSGNNEDNIYTNNSSGGIYKVYGADNGQPGAPNGPLQKGPEQFSSIFSGGVANHYVELQVTEFSEFWLHGSYHGAPLPVEMIYFQAEAINNSYIKLSWATAIEINNDGFRVERSTDAQNWSTIGWVDGHDNSTVQHDYSYNDYNVEPNVRYYYRLKQMDNDGQYEYTDIVSEIITTQVSFGVKDFIPNPTMNNTSLIVTSSTEQTIEVKFYDVIGQVVSSSKHELHKGGNQIMFSLEHLSAGTYTAIVSSGNEVYTKKLVITR